MNYRKLTDGYVEQVFNDEGICLGQRFIAYDTVEFTTDDGEPINSQNMPYGGNEHYPFTMENELPDEV